ncbi:hypothetical protein KEM56_007483 [Ascosphaera pollenicola]|nr:hypothetical protein KEM56_007483 [Ascosphaera pollenicola]
MARVGRARRGRRGRSRRGKNPHSHGGASHQNAIASRLAAQHSHQPPSGAMLRVESPSESSRQPVNPQGTVMNQTGRGLEQVRFDTEGAPNGYIFMPKGNPYVTKHCRAKTIGQGKVLYTVLDARKDTKLGLYVPAPIASEVYGQEEATRAERAKAVLKKDTQDTERYQSQLLKGYPNIPTRDVLRILSHAFLKGSRRVGRSTTVRGGEETKLRLAVEAHIRHVHTDYESLLRSGVARWKARERVGSAVRRLRDEWAGLQKPGPVSKAEKTREAPQQVQEPEIIVISSDSSDVEILSGWD